RRHSRARPPTVAPACPAEDRDVDPRLAPRLRRRGAGPDRDSPLCAAARLALATAARGRVRPVPGGRPDRRLAARKRRSAALLARLRTPRRLRRDRGQEAPRRPVLGPAHGAGAWRYRRRLPPPQPWLPSG